ncbi:unnamed protein product [Cuscuta campestris]|uniref:DUF632 domain-containing protein n=1 Tax=Cuscuta campestris TaxID=132261 RepID=A0A484LPI3_9ASTE|nr:unnamed protein product [Cuscuta campestris]
MGCVASKVKQEEEGEGVVSICRERKKQLKLTVERRYSLADTHHRYCQALNGVSAAIKLFVARHFSPSSPYLITFPPPPGGSSSNSTSSSTPLFLQQKPSQQATTTPTPKETPCCVDSSGEEEEEGEEEREEIRHVEKKEERAASVCEYFYMEMPREEEVLQHSAPPAGGYGGWDFFSPFNVYNHQISEEDLKAVREREGIPELEKEEECGGMMEEERAENEEEVELKKMENGGEEVKGGESRKVVADMEGKEGLHSEGMTEALAEMERGLEEEGGRELLEALKDIEDHFSKAYDSGKEVSRMLESNWVYTQPNLEDLRGHITTKLITLTWKPTPSAHSSLSSSSKNSLVASTSRSSSTWMSDFSNDLLGDFGESGSLLLTLGRLYAWEKKLYEEVKDGDSTWKLYEKRCKKLKRTQDATRIDAEEGKKGAATLKELHSRIIVAIRSAETISKRIEQLRDEELQPQVIQLLQGMMRGWKMMLESHELQNKIMSQVSTFNCPAYGKFCNDSHRLATLQLEVELQNWRSCFTAYIAAQKAYVQSLHAWLSKFVVVDFYSNAGPPLLNVCRDWLSAMNNLPEKSVSCALKSCAKDIRALWVQQGVEQQHKRKVDSLSKELERKTLAFQRAEERVFEFKKFADSRNAELEMEHRAEVLREQKDLLDDFSRRVGLEREEHRKSMQETQRITLRGFQSGFGSVFESMAEFSRAALKMYNEVLSAWENSQKNSQVDEDVKR